MTHNLGNAVEYLAVVQLQHHIDSEFAKYTLHNRNQLHLVHQRARADNIDIALVELTIATLLWAVSTPYRLNLITLEWECNLVLVLHDIASKRNGQVIS